MTDAAENGDAAPVPQRTRKQHVIGFAKKIWYVPHSAVASYPKAANVIGSVKELNELLVARAPAAWLPYCTSETLFQISGAEGSSVYTCFDIEGTEQFRWIELIPKPIAEKNFPKLLAEWQNDPDRPKPADAKDAATRERQQKRMDVLRWTPADCAGAQVSPEKNGWERCHESGFATLVTKPPAKKKVGDKRGADEGEGESIDVSGVKIRVVAVEGSRDATEGPSYSIVELPGKILILSTGTADAAAEAEAAEA